MMRRGAILLAALVVAGLVAVAALPFVASTQIVKHRIAQEFSHWSGYRVILGGSPEITVWPSMRAVLGNVRLTGWSENAKTVLASEKVEIDLSALAALRGKIVPLRVRFVRPVLRVETDGANYTLRPAAAGGKFIRAVRAATEIVAADPANPAVDQLPNDTLGTMEFVDGRIVVDSGDDGGEQEIMSSLTGTMQWAAMNRALTLQTKVIWRGESVAINATLQQPLILFAGGIAPVRFSLQSAPITASFDGSVDIDRPIFVNGALSVSSPSLRRALEWSGTDIGTDFSVGAVSISGRINGQAQRLKIEEASIALGENPGTGIIEAAFDGNMPEISGTLDFQVLDLVSFMSSFAVLPLEPNAATGSLDSKLIDTVNLDLRLSAERATAGPISMAKVAAVVQVKDRLVTFDISDAAAFGGTVLTGLRIDRKLGTDAGEFRLLASNIDGGALAQTAGADRLIPKARGKISVILNGPLAAPDQFLKVASGSIAASFGTGTIANLNLQTFLERARQGGFFSLDEVEQGTLAFERFELKATMSGGVAHIDKISVRTARQQIELAGVADYEGKSLALSGVVGPVATEADGDVIRFFAGGSWNSPFISAALGPNMAP